MMKHHIVLILLSLALIALMACEPEETTVNDSDVAATINAAVEATVSARNINASQVQPSATPTSPVDPSTPEEQINLMLAVRLIEKTYTPQNASSGRIEDRINFVFEFENISDVEIRALTGIAIFADVFERPFKSLRLTHDDPIPPHSTQVVTSLGFDPNQFSEDDQQLITTDLQNVVFQFDPESVILGDGTHIGSISN